MSAIILDLVSSPCDKKNVQLYQLKEKIPLFFPHFNSYLQNAAKNFTHPLTNARKCCIISITLWTTFPPCTLVQVLSATVESGQKVLSVIPLEKHVLRLLTRNCTKMSIGAEVSEASHESLHVVLRSPIQLFLSKQRESGGDSRESFSHDIPYWCFFSL